MRVLLSGGGTGGPVTPLLAVVELLRQKEPTAKLLWLGTDSGPEKKLVESQGVEFKAIAAGKLRRYFSWQNFLDPFRLARGFFQALKMIRNFKPDIILSAGGFVSVPVIWAGWFARVPSIVHQQDYYPILAVKLVVPFVKLITVSFQATAKFFPPGKVKWIGHPIRNFLLRANRAEAFKHFKLESGLPTVFVTGGGTGAQRLNEIINQSLPDLLKFCQIIHLTGAGKSFQPNVPANLAGRYHQYEFFAQEMGLAYAAADLMVSRAGASAIFEIARLGKATILIPLPDSPQEKNAEIFAQNEAALVISQADLTFQKLTLSIKELIDKIEKRQSLQKNAAKMNTSDAVKQFISELWKIKKSRP